MPVNKPRPTRPKPPKTPAKPMMPSMHNQIGNKTLPPKTAKPAPSPNGGKPGPSNSTGARPAMGMMPKFPSQDPKAKPAGPARGMGTPQALPMKSNSAGVASTTKKVKSFMKKYGQA